ncbi:hypothetical protein DAPPUDRAFT_331310 [Daphnia pulex]|uniref:CUB domain-containing protein n=1 Tax=Daphnia pulex TaxID=6669 RepID=E9HM38_DAPPU|nr:hypothetical protein DAPPUDRAFT_331310 [Daphnia pulex]|eukprot:EFX67173.1 hypothetical protein DAPPUDRAFT_331310 [Daphnia pulex]
MCGNVTSTGNGVVQSPNFPGDYGNEDRFCIVTISAPAGWMIQAKFTTFNLETNKAYVSVFGQSLVMSRATGSTIPGVVPATTKVMNIGFETSASDKPTGAVYNWQATFSVTEISFCRCGFDLRGRQDCGTMCTNVTSTGNGVIQSRNFPGDYGNEYRNCPVTIIVPAGKRIRLEFTTFNLETDIGYIETGLMFSDGETEFDATGSTIPAAVTTTKNTMLLVFKTLGSSKPNTTTYNWQATYTAV